MKLVAELEKEEDIVRLPYKQRPKTIWTVLMFLWLTAYRKENKFSEEELRQFFSKGKTLKYKEVRSLDHYRLLMENLVIIIKDGI